MWEGITTILTSDNGVIVGVLFIIIFIIISFEINQGLINFKGNKLKIGQTARINEREILQKQIEYATKYVESRMSLLDLSKLRYSGYMARYVLEKALDEIISWIMFNHMSTDKEYIKMKQNKMNLTIFAIHDIQPEFKSDEFKQTINNWVEEIIKELIMIRKQYNVE